MIKDKDLAVKLLLEKSENDFIHTYSEIERMSGYSSRSLMRMMSDIRNKKDTTSILTHGNTGRQPSTTASEDEYNYLREFKKPYPKITIAQFRDFYLEDVIGNPDKQDDVQKYGLKPRSKSWFRDLFIKEGWTSPASKTCRGERESHPIRNPAAQEGLLVQIDGTEYDWFQDGNTFVLHSAIDDATTTNLAGWFMPVECTTGYCYMMRKVLQYYGKPVALYSDRHSIFKSVKNGAISQFGMMMQDLGIDMIFALSSQAKGRVERYNQTAQLRLVNDIKRFNIKNVVELNEWYNDFYRHYLNKKFSFRAADPTSAFIPMNDDFDYSAIFRGRMTRIIHEDMFSYEMNYYAACDESGEVLHLNNGTKVNLYIDAFTKEMYIERYNKRYPCFVVKARQTRSEISEAKNEKEVSEMLREYRNQK